MQPEYSKIAQRDVHGRPEAARRRIFVECLGIRTAKSYAETATVMSDLRGHRFGRGKIKARTIKREGIQANIRQERDS